jgi:hypothetical protein
MTTISWSLFCIALGAIFKWAITASLAGVDMHVVGVILMVVGVIGLCIGVVALYRGRSDVSARRGYR